MTNAEGGTIDHLFENSFPLKVPLNIHFNLFLLGKGLWFVERGSRACNGFALGSSTLGKFLKAKWDTILF